MFLRDKLITGELSPNQDVYFEEDGYDHRIREAKVDTFKDLVLS
jgi:hypothetical protein